MAGEARVRIASFDSRIAAEISRSRLEALGIPSWIEADDAGGAYPQLQSFGVRLVVDAEDAYRAREALAGVEPIEDLPEGEAASSDAPDPRVATSGRSWLVSVLLMILGMALGAALARLDLSGSKDAGFTGEVEEDADGDGKVDTWRVYDDGVGTATRYDRNGDGLADYWHFHGSAGESSKSDDDFDGRPDAWLRYRNGFPAEAEQDVDGNGLADLFTSFEHGVPTSEVLRPDRGAPEREDRYVNGVLREVFEITPSGERRRVRSYDAAGNEVPPP